MSAERCPTERPAGTRAASQELANHPYSTGHATGETAEVQTRRCGEDIPWNSVTEAQRHRGTKAQRHRGTEAQRHRGTKVQRHRGIEARRRKGTEG